MITRAKLSSVVQGLPKYRSMLAGNTAYIPTYYDSIASVTSAGTMQFTSIPQTFKHLEIRYTLSSNSYGNSMNVTFNGSSTGYTAGSFNAFFGSPVYTYAQVNQTATSIPLTPGTGDTASTGPVFGTLTIFNYSSTSKNKTLLSQAGLLPDSTTQAIEGFNFGTWLNTNAITSITFSPGGGSFTGAQSFALYGIGGS